MPQGNPSPLLLLADREFRELTNKPVTIDPARKFKPVKLNVARFDNTWERKRGAAVRLTAVLLREDDSTLERRVCENEISTKTYTDAVAWLRLTALPWRRRQDGTERSARGWSV